MTGIVLENRALQGWVDLRHLFLLPKGYFTARVRHGRTYLYLYSMHIAKSRKKVENFFKRIYRKIFILPPIPERRMVEGPIKKILYPHLRKEADDTYIYYLVMKNSFLMAGFFSILYWASYTFDIKFDFILFSIYVEQIGFVRSMIWSYPFLVSTILLIIFVPYAWLLFRANIDFNTCDLLWWNDIILANTKGDRKKIIKTYRTGFFLLLIAMYGAFGLPELILRYKIYENLNNSYVFFVVILAAYAWIYSVIMSGFVICSAGYWQHWKRLGPRYQKESI